MKRVRRASDGANELDANIEWGMVAVRAVDTGVRADHFWSLLFVCDAVRTMFTVAPGWGATEVVSVEGEALASALSQGLVMIVRWHGLQYMLYQIEDRQRVREVEYRKSAREDAEA